MAIKEFNFEWSRAGEPIADVIAEMAGIDERPAEDIREVLDGRHWSDPSEMEGPFDGEAHYEEKGVEDIEFRSEWDNFESSLKAKKRFFGSEPILSRIFGEITKFKTSDARSVIVEAGPGLTISKLYRARQ